MSTEIYAAAKACVPAEEEAAGRESLIHIPLLLFLLAGQILPVYALWMIMLLGCLALTVRGRGHFIFRQCMLKTMLFISWSFNIKNYKILFIRMQQL